MKRAAALTVFSLCFAASSHVDAQAPRRTAGGDARPPSGIEDREIFVNRQQLDAVARQLAGSKSSSGGGGRLNIGRIVKQTLGGDEHRQKAAEELIEIEAASEAAQRSSTVVVVIGGDEERQKVRHSLTEVRRPIVLLYVNPEVQNESSDNTPFKAGVAGQLVNSATNVWLFSPETGASADPEPTKRLSTTVISPQVWSAMFAAEGDASAAASLASGLRTAPGERSEQPASGAANHTSPAARAMFAEGDVLTPKIATVRLMAQPADGAAIVATLTKSDEVVVIGGEKSGYVNVEGAAAAGWVKAALVSKK